jgi:hypothetical protein
LGWLHAVAMAMAVAPRAVWALALALMVLVSWGIVSVSVCRVVLRWDVAGWLRFSVRGWLGRWWRSCESAV